MQEHTQPISDEAAAEVEEHLERHIHSNSTLDSLILSRLDDDGQPIPPEPVREFEDFVAARPYRKELSERHGGSASDVIEAFSRYSHDLKTNGALAGEKLAGDYYASTSVAKMRHAIEKQKADLEPKTAKADEQDNVFSGVKLDRSIENAFDETDERAKEQAEFKRAIEIFAPIKAENPHLTFQEFFKNTTVADRELCRDPAFAYRLSAASGTPVTELQKEMAQIKAENEAQQTAEAHSLLAQMSNSGELVNFDRHRPVMAELLVHPNFVSTGDTREDVRRANRTAEIMARNNLTIKDWERHEAVEKAKRAAPVKVSGGNRTASFGETGAGSHPSLDSILSTATSHLADDD